MTRLSRSLGQTDVQTKENQIWITKSQWEMRIDYPQLCYCGLYSTGLRSMDPCCICVVLVSYLSYHVIIFQKLLVSLYRTCTRTRVHVRVHASLAWGLLICRWSLFGFCIRGLYNEEWCIIIVTAVSTLGLYDGWWD